jgi:hypothetical protein
MQSYTVRYDAAYLELVPDRSSPRPSCLRESFRDNGWVRKRTLANPSSHTVLVEGFHMLLKGGLAGTAEADPHPPCTAARP